MNIRALSVATLLLLLGASCFAQQWQFTGSINSARRHMSANLLSDGTILIAGGMEVGAISVATCERYNPALETWTAVASLNLPRFQHTTHLLPTGEVIAIGGYSNGTITSSVEMFSPFMNIWSAVGDLNTGRMNHTSTLLPDGRILIVGGFDGSSYLASCEFYNPLTNTSTPAASLNLGRHDHNAILLQSGNVLITGGRIGGASGTYLANAELYDPASDTWTTIDEMNSSRIIGTLVEFSDLSILAAGGRSTANSSTTSADLFDPITQTWNAVAPMHDKRHWQGESLMPNDRYLITGGIEDAVWTQHNDVEVTNTCEWFDKQTGTWFYAPDMQIERSQHGQIYFTQTGNENLPTECVIVIGGISTGLDNFTATCEILDVNPPQLEGYKTLPRNMPASVDAENPSLGVRIIGNTTRTPILVFDNADIAASSTIDLISEHGLVLSTIDCASMGIVTRIPLDLRSMQCGLYFLRVRNHTGTGVLKLAVIK